MITLRDIHKSFGSNHVLQDTNLHVAQGESAVIIGGSGTGKSVLLKCILGLVTPDQGSVHLNGNPLTPKNIHEFLDQFGMLFQGAALFDSLSIWQNVAFRLLRGPEKLSKADAKEIAVSKLARVGLGSDVADRLPAELSGGMQKRAGLARAIATDPQVIFFDEPTAGLDPIMASVINELIAELVSEMGATAITITHDMTTVRTVAHKIHMLFGGRIIWSGSPDLLENCDNAHVDQFINGRADGPIPAVR